jgi:membrane glycosyltransferase
LIPGAHRMEESKNTAEIPWIRAARIRRVLLLGLIAVTSVLASFHMAHVLPNRGTTPLELIVVIVFTVLFAWISIGFWLAMAGLFVLAKRYDRFSLSLDNSDVPPCDTDARTAVLFPIANEDVRRVFAGLRATCESLASTGQTSRFDFFVLSDTSDPDKWVEEEVSWAETCRLLGASHRIFYRRRRVNLKRKSGNISDFCRRWGKNYRYMVIMDADSVMKGDTLIRMVQMMEQHPKVGILQTAPLSVNRETLIGRAQQFAGHVYGPVFAAGLHCIQLGDSHFWGHNAILRVAPFMAHCSLPELPGKPPRGGYIMSHDFVEAAYMRRAGWEVWLAHDLEGSYEEVPPTLIEEIKRDRRWCQGNLQHIRLLFTKGLLPAHRALFLHGAMSYGSSLLWVLFLALSSAEAIVEAFRAPVYFPSSRVLFPEWPVWHPRWGFTLLAMTGIILFMPKVLSALLLLLKKRKAESFGGPFSLLAGLSAEVLVSALFAPIRMFFHSKFVFMTLLGRQIGWGPQQRNDLGTGWREAFHFHLSGVILAIVWGMVLFAYNRSFFWWITPVWMPLVLSIPLSVWSSRATVGRALRRMRLLVIPEEMHRPELLQALDRILLEEEMPSPLSIPREQGFVRAVVDPQVHAVHICLNQKRDRVSGRIADRRRRLVEKALSEGPAKLSLEEKRTLLSDPELLNQLHQGVWEISNPDLERQWGLPP